MAARDNPNGDELIARTERSEANGTEVVSEAHDGAAAVVGEYTDTEFESMVTLVAVRAPSRALMSYLFTEPEDLGLAVAMEEVIDAGAVECLVRNPPIFEDQDIDTGDRVALLCQRTDENLTVQLVPSGQSDVAAMAGIVDDAWEHIAGED